MAISLSGCENQTIQKLQGQAQGTTYHISYWTPSPVDHKEIEKNIASEFTSIDKLLSNYRPDSTIETFNSLETLESFRLGPEIVTLINIAKTVYIASHGCYDLSIKPLFDLWGFNKDQQKVPPDSAISATLKSVGMDKLEIIDASNARKKLQTLKIDLSSIAQGYSVERISKIFEAKNIGNYLVEIGGELKTNGHKPDGQAWRIAVERPIPGEKMLHKVITMPKDQPAAVMTSGTYRHYFDENGVRYSHILDARTGRPISHDLVSVSVINPDPTLADAWSTALLCLGRDDGLKAANEAKIAALFIQQQDGKLIETKSDAIHAMTSLTIH